MRILSYSREYTKALISSALQYRYNLLRETNLLNAPFATSLAQSTDADLLNLLACVDSANHLPSPPKEYQVLKGRHYFRLDHTDMKVTGNGIPSIGSQIIWCGLNPAIGYLRTAMSSLHRTRTIKASLVCLWPHTWLSYGDFVLSILPRITYLKQQLKQSEWDNIVIVIGLEPPEFFYQAVELLGLSREQVLHQQGTLLKPAPGYTVFVAQCPPLNLHDPTPDEFESLRKAAGVTETDSDQKLLVSRGPGDRRQLKGDDAWITAAFSEAGYESIIPGHYSVKDQIRIFSRSSHIAGIHGGGIGNIVWAPHSIKFMEWFHPGFNLSCYRVIAAMLQGHYTASGYREWNSKDLSRISADVQPDKALVEQFLSS